MGYRIDYQPVRKLRGLEKRHHTVAAMTGLCFLLFLFGVEILWPEGWALLQQVVFSGDTSVTAAAMENLAGNLENGLSVREAITGFCRQILEGRQLVPN